LKKILCIILSLTILCLCTTSCRKETKIINKVEYPLEEISAIYDSNNNLLQQTLVNKETGDYIFKEFVYENRNNFWVCIDQRTSILEKNVDKASFDPLLKIHYNKSLYDAPIIIMDNEYVKISIIKYLSKADWWEFGYELKIYNKTNNLLSVLIDDCYIMDILCKPLFTVDHIEAGKTVYFKIAWDSDTLKRCKIPYIDDVEFMVRVFNTEDWTTPALAGNRIMIKN
jgi:hypothetical protein